MRILLLILFWIVVIQLVAQNETPIRAIDSLESLLVSTYQDDRKIELLNKIAIQYANVDPDTAIEIAYQTLQIANQKKDTRLIADSYLTVASLHRKQGRHDITQFYADSAISNYAFIQDANAIIETEILKLRTYGRNGDYQKGVDLATNLLLKIDSLKATEFEPVVLNLMGILHEDLEQNESAKDYFDLALKSALKEGNKQVEMWVYNNVSGLYRHAKQFDKSVEFVKRAGQIAVEINDRPQIGRSLSNLGATYYRMGEPDSSEHYLKKAYNFYNHNEIEFASEIVKATWHLSELYLNLKKPEPEKARPYLKECLALAKKYQLEEDICYAYELIFKMEKLSGNLEEAGVIGDSLLNCKENIYNKNLGDQQQSTTARYEKLLLEKESIKQKAAFDQLKIRNRNNRRIIFLISLASLLALILAILYSRNRDAKRKLLLEEAYQEELTKKIEEDRKRRAAELHDDIGQQLVLMKQMLDNKGEVEEGKQMLQEAINKVRSISRDEYPYQLKYLGLKTTLEDLIDRIENSSSLVVSEGLDDIPSISIESSLHIFRIVQECFNNTLKYAGAPSVQIKISQDGEDLIMEYQDSGNAFDFENKLTTTHSLGLKTIIDRVRILKGKVKTVPSKTKGNKYLFHIPIHKIENAK